MRIISQEDVRKVLDMETSINYMENVFADYSSGNVNLPLRTRINIENKGDILFMPAYIPNQESVGTKIVSVFPSNIERNMKTINSVLLLNDVSTGQPIALMDAEYLTAMRTGGVCGAAAKSLAKEDSSVVSVFGAGTQGGALLEAICCVRNIKKVYVFDSSEERIKAFISKMEKSLSIQFLFGISEEEALSKTDIILTATTSSLPVFNGNNVKPGTFVAAVGAYTKTMQELPENLLAKATIIVDAYTAAMVEAGDILIPMGNGTINRDSIKGELGEVMLQKVKRENKEEIIVFKSVGIAIQDMCLAAFIYKKAVEKDLGILVDI